MGKYENQQQKMNDWQNWRDWQQRSWRDSGQRGGRRDIKGKTRTKRPDTNMTALMVLLLLMVLVMERWHQCRWMVLLLLMALLMEQWHQCRWGKRGGGDSSDASRCGSSYG